MLVLVGEVPRVFILSRKFEPGNLVNVKSVEDGDASEHFKSIELDKLENFLVKDFFVFSLHEPRRHHIRHKLAQKVSDISVLRISVKKLSVHITSLLRTSLCLNFEALFTLLPAVKHGAILGQIIVIVELPLFADHTLNNLLGFLIDRFANAVKPENLC